MILPAVIVFKRILLGHRLQAAGQESPPAHTDRTTDTRRVPSAREELFAWFASVFFRWSES